MRQRSDRLGRHILERNRAKPLLLGNRAGTGLRDRQIRPAGRGGRLRVAQHQPDGIRLLPGRTRGLRKAFGRLSLTGALRFQRSHNSVKHPQDQRKGAQRVGLGGRTRPLAYEPGFVQHVRGAAGRVHSGPHVDKPCRIPPCFQLGHVPGRDPLGPPLHLDGGGGWGCHGRPFIQCARAHRPTGKEKKIPAVGGDRYSPPIHLLGPGPGPTKTRRRERSG